MYLEIYPSSYGGSTDSCNVSSLGSVILLYLKQGIFEKEEN